VRWLVEPGGRIVRQRARSRAVVLLLESIRLLAAIAAGAVGGCPREDAETLLALVSSIFG